MRILIEKGLILDGTGRPGFPGDLVVEGNVPKGCVFTLSLPAWPHRNGMSQGVSVTYKNKKGDGDGEDG